MGRLQDKVALITGAASGIGRATAERFAEEGARLAVSDRKDDALAETTTRLTDAGGTVLALHLDVTREEEWTAALAAVDRRFGRLDVLVNNAGYGALKSIADTSFDDWRSLIAVNLDSVFLGVKHAIPLMARGGGGSIVNVSSIRALVAGEGSGAYCAAKAGVHLFTKVAALECAAAQNGIRVNSVHPGFVDTPLTAPQLGNEEWRRRSLAKTPAGRLAAPREIADAILYLASDESSFVNAAALVVDGGFTAR
jgi:NAD(P)-dependent dehydrogenase (short-subunit alcohol dehydrogenase family)